MHRQAYEFVQRVMRDVDPAGLRVLEFGSYNVNGTVRPLFPGAAEYVGVDLRAGPGVDVVADAATVDGLEDFDVLVCCEVLEHTPDPAALITAAWRSLKPGGALILTAAGPGRAPHGVNGGPVGREHYANISPDQLGAWLSDWDALIKQDERAGDVYAVARKLAVEAEA